MKERERERERDRDRDRQILILKNQYFRVPDGFKLSWTRKHELQWKDVKNVYICSLHFESACFHKNKLNFNIAVPVQTPSVSVIDHNSVSDIDNVVQVPSTSDHDYVTPPDRSKSDDFDDTKKKDEAEIKKT